MKELTSSFVTSPTREQSGCFLKVQAPMIRHSPVSLECKVVTRVDLPSNEFFVGEIVGVYTEERYLTNGKPDIKKIRPFMLTMPDGRYRDVGEILGNAWSIGKGFKV